MKAAHIAALPLVLFLLALYFDEISAFFTAEHEQEQTTINTAPQMTGFGSLRGTSKQSKRARRRLVFLDDIQPVHEHVGYGDLGRHGDMGFEGLRVIVGGKNFAHALSMHPAYKGTAFAAYDLSSLKSSTIASSRRMRIQPTRKTPHYR